MLDSTLKPDVSDVPETMLWTLHNRVSEASRIDGILCDPFCVQIYKSLEYDYEKSFGMAEPSHAVRSAMFDNELRLFLKKHPNGVIVNLGEGLETQRFRVQGNKSFWLSIDLPEAIKIREYFIKPDDNHRHISLSALDRAWFDEVPDNRPVYITAQGLLMYFHEHEVKSLFQDFSWRFPGSFFAFDTIPVWISQKTINKGWKKTPHYTTPKMPWGIDHDKIFSTLMSWVPTIKEIKDLRWWGFPRGIGRWLFPLIISTPIISRYTPAITRVNF